MIVLLILAFIAIIAFEAPGLVKKKMWRELAAFSVLLLIGMVLSFGQALKLPVPNPTKGIDAVFKPVTQFIESMLT
ncbi:hypothetical protein Psch_00873 [Pelotomaculum schinkii]|uniref:Uncharacterized protein n=1 Tax=Pelotomaculum schinkii TaxID=78350 RepID=A0A4Y7REU8_9FIRM|nr:hypothetical protein [Pelotomaculum schinkii]TEB07326.1 hypothetical protein Psch_00873 [Pelotomaculum schinkii]